MFLNNLSLFSSYRNGRFKIEVNADTYKFIFATEDSESSKQLYTYGLKFFYSDLFFGVIAEDQPLFKNSSGVIQVVAEKSILPTIGYEWKTSLSKNNKSSFSVQTSVSYLMSSSASNPDVKISGQTGLGADLKTKFTQRISSDKKSAISYYWSNDLGYRDYERQVIWGGSQGNVTSTHINFSTSIGLKFEF